uniref:Uncharacterized protein n=1 Tax=Romanomermis culicivorax TaxID=13658 RepID=A0A915JB72_ROMCU
MGIGQLGIRSIGNLLDWEFAQMGISRGKLRGACCYFASICKWSSGRRTAMENSMDAVASHKKLSRLQITMEKSDKKEKAM